MHKSFRIIQGIYVVGENISAQSLVGRFALEHHPITESRDDCILIIIGGSRVKLLQQFIEDSGEYNLERAGKYF